MRQTKITRNKVASDSSNNTFIISTDADIMCNGNMLEMFGAASEVEVKEIINKYSNKS